MNDTAQAAAAPASHFAPLTAVILSAVAVVSATFGLFNSILTDLMPQVDGAMQTVSFVSFGTVIVLLALTLFLRKRLRALAQMAWAGAGVALLVIAAFVYLAFSEAVTEHIWSTFSVRDIGVVIALDILLLVVVLIVTMYGSRLMGFSREDEIAITFCGSKKSLASGVPMANVIFAGQGIGSIVLPLMLFHQIQLMACAVIAQKYAERSRRLAVAAAE